MASLCFLASFISKCANMFMSPHFSEIPMQPQDEIHRLAKKSLPERIEENGANSDLFDLLQEVVAIVQLRFISDFELGPSMSLG